MNQIYLGEIWKKTQCLAQEEQTNQLIFKYLNQIGFSKTDQNRIWKRKNQTVIVCLVDDIITCGTDYTIDIPYFYDKNTTVITDNYLTCPTVYRVLKLPTSFFGIYSYTPEDQHWDPQKDFSFSVNRIDYRRFYLMLDLAKRTQLESGFINFNCQDRNNFNLTPVEAFAQFWNHLGPHDQTHLKSAYQKISPLMPLKNYDLDFDSISTKSWINIIIETYGSDNVVSLSEKIFRALVTPAPWTVYSGRYTVAYLESLGFDCMTDIVDHNYYDRLKEIEGKLSTFNWKSLEIVSNLKNIGIKKVKQRCIDAAKNNQQLLKTYSESFPAELNTWINTLNLN